MRPERERTDGASTVQSPPERERPNGRSHDAAGEAVTGRRGFISLAAAAGGGLITIGAASAQRLTGEDIEFLGCRTARVRGIEDRDVTVHITKDKTTGDGDDKVITKSPCPPGVACHKPPSPYVTATYDFKSNDAKLEAKKGWILHRVTVRSAGITKAQSIRRCGSSLEIRFLNCREARVLDIRDRDVKVYITRDGRTGDGDDKVITKSPCPPGVACHKPPSPHVTATYDFKSNDAKLEAKKGWRIYKISVPSVGASKTQNVWRC